MNVIKISKNLKGFVYAFITLLIFLLLIKINNEYSLKEYIFYSISGGLIFILLLFFSWWYPKKAFKQDYLPKIILSEHPIGLVVNHYIVPSLLYIGIVLFIYVNRDYVLKGLIILSSFFIFGLLFDSIRIFQERRELLVSAFDSAKLFLFFVLINSLLRLRLEYNLNLTVTLTIVFMLVFLLNLLMFLRNLKPGHLELGYMLGVALFITLIYYAFSNFGNYLTTNFILLVTYYFSIAAITHKIERTLTIKLLFEYVLFLCLSIILLFNIS